MGVIGRGVGYPVDPDHARQRPSSLCSSATPNFSRPAYNGPVCAEKKARFDADPPAYREAARWSPPASPRAEHGANVPGVRSGARREVRSGVCVGDLLAFASTYADIGSNPEANETVAEFMRGKIRSIVASRDGETLCPRTTSTAPASVPRHGVYETFNLPHVRLVDLRKEPTGRSPNGRRHGVPVVQFDAISSSPPVRRDEPAPSSRATSRTGSMASPTSGPTARRPTSAVTTAFRTSHHHRPGSPSCSRHGVSIEQHADWVSRCLVTARAAGST